MRPSFRSAMLVVATLALLSPQAAVAEPSDPAAVMEAYTAAINAHDAEAALALVADDAVYQRPAGQFTGKAEVRRFIEGLIARKVKVELIGERTVDGETVTWRSRVTLAGPDQTIENASQSVIRDGKIVMHSAAPAQ